MGGLSESSEAESPEFEPPQSDEAGPFGKTARRKAQPGGKWANRNGTQTAPNMSPVNGHMDANTPRYEDPEHFPIKFKLPKLAAVTKTRKYTIFEELREIERLEELNESAKHVQDPNASADKIPAWVDNIGSGAGASSPSQRKTSRLRFKHGSRTSKHSRLKRETLAAHLHGQPSAFNRVHTPTHIFEGASKYELRQRLKHLFLLILFTLLHSQHLLTYS
jgi:hypothetical protein